MGVRYEKKRISQNVPVGMTCDCCGKEFCEQGMQINDFRLQHTFGYGSAIDMTSVSAAICDECLFDIVVEKLPGAVFTDHHNQRSRDRLIELVRESRERRQTAG
jgi:hypothetical protein